MSAMNDAKDSTSFNFVVNHKDDVSKKGQVGFIASESKPFCNGCSRLRLSSKGTLRPCLFKRDGESLRGVDIKDYPDILKTIPDPPPFLFYIGEKIESGIGIVGTRNPSEKSLKTVESVVEKERSTVISGGAKGIDYKAHLFALEQRIPTVIVLGSGILEMDRRIKVLLEKYENISVVSEFLPWKKANKYTFPRRNRIIAGLSEKIFVIEAGRKSGALITASYAKRYGRKVFVYIGDENSERWEGCKELLKKGIAKKIELGGDLNKDLISFLSKPRTFDEIMSFLDSNRKDTLSVLTRLILEGKIIQEGAYYTRI